MKIIKEGSLDTLILKAIKTFTCEKCGCVFEAKKGEYEFSGLHYNESYYESICPYCGNKVYCSDN